MTRASTLPLWTLLTSHVYQGLTLPSPSDATIMMKNAILHVMLRTCQRGCLAVGDLCILNNAWGYLHSTPSPLSQLADSANPANPANTANPPNRWKHQHHDQMDDERPVKNPKKPCLPRDEPDDDEIDKLKGKDDNHNEGMDLQTFTAQFSIPNIDDVESWPELVILNSTFDTASCISNPPQEKVCQGQYQNFYIYLTHGVDGNQVHLPLCLYGRTCIYRVDNGRIFFPPLPQFCESPAQLRISLTCCHQEPIQRLSGLLEGTTLDET